MIYGLTQATLHSILDYDPVTHRLTPKAAIPEGLPKPRKNGAHQLIIGDHNYSLSKLAYMYHHGKAAAKVKHKDANKSNYAPDNLEAYKPAGRAHDEPYIDVIKNTDKVHGITYTAVIKPPKNPVTTPLVSFIPIHDQFGFALTSPSADYVKRVAAKFVKTLTEQQRKQLGAPSKRKTHVRL